MMHGAMLRLSDVHAAIAAKEGQCLADIAQAVRARAGFVRHGIEALIKAGVVARITHQGSPFPTYSTIDAVAFEDAPVAAPAAPSPAAKAKRRGPYELRLVKSDGAEPKEPLLDWQKLEFARRKAADRIAVHAMRMCLDESGKDAIRLSATLFELGEAYERAAKELKRASVLALKPKKTQAKKPAAEKEIAQAS